MFFIAMVVGVATGAFMRPVRVSAWQSDLSFAGVEFLSYRRRSFCTVVTQFTKDARRSR